MLYEGIFGRVTFFDGSRNPLPGRAAAFSPVDNPGVFPEGIYFFVSACIRGLAFGDIYYLCMGTVYKTTLNGKDL